MTESTQHDLIFRGALVVDGSGTAPVVADLAVTDDRISGLGDLSEHLAGTVVDARGRALAPGFIDAHCHDDGELITGPLLAPKTSQGVTTGRQRQLRDQPCAHAPGFTARASAAQSRQP